MPHSGAGLSREARPPLRGAGLGKPNHGLAGGDDLSRLAERFDHRSIRVSHQDGISRLVLGDARLRCVGRGEPRLRCVGRGFRVFGASCRASLKDPTASAFDKSLRKHNQMSTFIDRLMQNRT